MSKFLELLAKLKKIEEDNKSRGKAVSSNHCSKENGSRYEGRALHFGSEIWGNFKLFVGISDKLAKAGNYGIFKIHQENGTNVIAEITFDDELCVFEVAYNSSQSEGDDRFYYMYNRCNYSAFVNQYHITDEEARFFTEEDFLKLYSFGHGRFSCERVGGSTFTLSLDLGRSTEIPISESAMLELRQEMNDYVKEKGLYLAFIGIR